jgi:hypothetical protein
MVWSLSAATLVALIALVWSVVQPAQGPAPDRTVRATASTAPRPAEPQRIVEPSGRVADAASGRSLPQARASRPRVGSMVRRPRGGVALPTSRSRREQAERLAALISVVRTLPSDVWERVDTAGPPAPLAPITVEEMSTDPITVAPLPSGERSDTPAPPGGFE